MAMFESQCGQCWTTADFVCACQVYMTCEEAKNCQRVLVEALGLHPKTSMGHAASHAEDAITGGPWHALI